MSKFELPKDVEDLQTELNMLILFKKSVNELIILHNVITSEGTVLVKGGAVHDLLVDIINCEKQLKMDMGIQPTPKELTSLEQKIAFMQLPIDERRKILSKQSEDFIMKNPNYYNEDNLI